MRGGLLAACGGLFFAFAYIEMFKHIIKMYGKGGQMWVYWAHQAVDWPHVLLWLTIGVFLVLTGILIQE